MTPWIEAIALWMADFYLAATILLILAGAALCLIKQPARRMAVAWGTLISLLVAALLCESASRPRVDPRQLFAREEQPAVQVETAERQVPEPPVSETSFAPQQLAPPERMDPPRQADPEPPVDPVAQPEIAVENPSGAGIDSRTIVGDAVLLFLTGAVLVAARLAVGAWQASRLIQKSLGASPALIDELRTIVGGGARLPRLRLNARLVTPVATGALWPTIVLPERFAENPQRRELRAVLGHEWAHIRNGDLWLALDRCLFPLLWAHPAYWWLRRRMRQDQEFLADAAAASLIGPADYAAQLVAWARDLAGVGRIVVSNAVGIWERPSGFAVRISTILDRADRITLRCSGRVRAAVVACLAAVSLAAASVSVRPPNAESAPPEAEAAPPENQAEPSQPDMLHLVADEIGGTCVDPQKAPVAGAEVLLYTTNFEEVTQRLVQRTSTDANGRFKFARLGPKGEVADDDVVVARRRGLGTVVNCTDSRGKPFEISMRKAAMFRGTVRDEKGKPLVGAQVSFPTGRRGVRCLVRPLEGVRCARTDAKGEFSVDDLEDFTYVRKEAPPGWRGGWASWGPPLMKVVRSDYVETWVQYKKVPGSADVVLADAAGISGQVVFGETGKPAAGVVVVVRSEPRGVRDVVETGADGRYRFDTLPEGSYALWVSSAPGSLTAPVVDAVEAHRRRTTQAPQMRLVKGGEIRGRIVDDVSGRPAAGMTVNLQGIYEQKGEAQNFFASTKSDALGQYHFTTLPSGKFNIFLKDTGAEVTAAAIDSLPVACSRTATAPPIHLIRGGVIKGRVIDDATGKPHILRDGEKLGVRIYGPTRPHSGAACDYAMVRKDGTFEMRVPPGETSLILISLDWTFNPTTDSEGEVSVSEGGEVHLEYHGTRFELPKAGDDKRTQTEKPLSVHVVDADGRPVSDATVVGCVASEKPASLERHEAQTDASGNAVLDVHGKKCSLLAFTQGGELSGQAAVAADGREGTIRLAASASISGRLVSTTLAPIVNRRLLCYVGEPSDRETRLPIEARTGGDGQFRFRGVPVEARIRLVAIAPLEGAFGIGAVFSVKESGIVRLGDVLEPEFTWRNNRSTGSKGWLPAIPLAVAEKGDRLRAAYAELAKTYRLAEGENVRHFAPPYPKARKDFFTAGDLENDPGFRNWFFRFSFHNDKIFQSGGASDHYLRFVIESVCDLPSEEIEGDDKVLTVRVAGDYVVRLGTPVEQRVRELEQILRKDAQLRVRLDLQQAAREVFVATGDFKLKPLPRQKKKNVIAVYGETPPEATNPNLGGGGSGSLEKFLKALGTHINQRIVTGAGTPPDQEISWHYFEGGLTGKRFSKGDRDPKLVLQHVAEQTGLTFHEEPRVVRVLHVE